MHAKDVAVQTLDFGDMVTKKYLEDLSDADLLVRPIPEMHHIAWQLGHLISSENQMVEAIAPGSSPALPEGFVAKHSKDAGKNDDPKSFLTKSEYLDAWDAQRAATKALLAKLSDAQLDEPAPETLRRMVATTGLVFNFVGAHVLMHVGQYVGVRRKCDKPIVV